VEQLGKEVTLKKVGQLLLLAFSSEGGFTAITN